MGATLPYPNQPANGQAPDAIPILANLLALLGAINGFDAAQVLAKTIVEGGLADQVNPRLRDGGWMVPFIESGGYTSSFVALGWTMPSGVAWLNGYRNAFSGASYTVAINSDTYYSVTQAGAINTPQAVANNATAPTLAVGSQWLAKVISNGSAITSIVDLRNLGPIAASGIYNPYKFSVYASTQTTIAASFVPTKIAFQTKTFDTGSNFDSTTNFRFTAPVAGCYWFSTQIASLVINTTTGQSFLYKNGAAIKDGTLQQNLAGSSVNITSVSSALVQLAAGDYVEAWEANNQGSTSNSVTGAVNTWFEGFMVSRT